MDRGAWRATVHRVAKSRKQLKRLNMHGPPAASSSSLTQSQLPRHGPLWGHCNVHQSVTDADFQQGSIIYILLVKSDLIFSLARDPLINHLLGLWSCSNYNNSMSLIFPTWGEKIEIMIIIIILWDARWKSFLSEAIFLFLSSSFYFSSSLVLLSIIYL